MNGKHTLVLLLLLLMTWPGIAQINDKTVFHAKRGNNIPWHTYSNNHRALYHIISEEAFTLLDARAERAAMLSTQAEWEAWQENIKPVLTQPLEKFSKTPLNARTTGILERETFTVEKVLFESHPGFYVTAALFLPKKRQNPAPAVIYCSGHTELGFRSETYQHVMLNLVKKGFIVFAFDPIGQGERLQYPDANSGHSKAGGPTKEHTYAGIQTLLTGTSLTDYFIWDGIRVLDYLETRHEVDMKRIGITGRSGGGTQTALIAAADNRIYAAAPENYITSFKRLLQSIGPQDAEQNPRNAIAKGFDFPDFLHLRAPKPTLVLTTTNDFFSIQGARETFAEGKKSYTAFGEPDNLQMTEDMGIHQSTLNNRKALYAFFQKHLKVPGEPTDDSTTFFSVKELWVTPTGQVETSYPGETIFSLNRKYFPGINFSEKNLQELVAKIAGISQSRKLKSPVYTGKFTGNGFEVEKYFLENSPGDFALPVYLIKKSNATNEKLVVWFHPGGKEKILEKPLLIEILNAGYTVVSADLPGTGELHDPEFSGDGTFSGVPFNYTFGACLIGKSIPGIQAEAIDLLMQYIGQDIRLKNADRIALVEGLAASPFLHYEVLNNNFSKAAFLNFPEPFVNLIEHRFYNPEEAYYTVPGSLQYYDLKDLAEYMKQSGSKIYFSENPAEWSFE